jgi:hypothetical protein
MEIGLFLLGVIVGVPITLVVETLIKRTGSRFSSWVKSGPGSALSHPLILSREGKGEDMMLRLSNHGFAKYRDIEIRVPGKRSGDDGFPIPAKQWPTVRLRKLDPGQSEIFAPTSIGLTAEEVHNAVPKVIGQMSPLTNEAIHTRSVFVNPSWLRRLFRPSIEWWWFTEPGSIQENKSLQYAVRAQYASTAAAAMRPMSSEVVAKIMALADADAEKVLQAKDSETDLQILRHALSEKEL